MKKTQQVTSVELSNRLHELGVTTPSMFFREWTGAKEDEIEMWKDEDGEYCLDNVNCYTVAELGEILPYNWFNFYVWDEENLTGYGLELVHSIFEEHREIADTEANARAKMLIYLIENNLIKI
jgi:hypothetical protein